MNAISDIEPTQMAQDVLTVLTLILVSAAVAGAALGVARIARLHKIVADASRPHRSGVLVPILGVIALAGSLAAMLDLAGGAGLGGWVPAGAGSAMLASFMMLTYAPARPLGTTRPEIVVKAGGAGQGTTQQGKPGQQKAA